MVCLVGCSCDRTPAGVVHLHHRGVQLFVFARPPLHAWLLHQLPVHAIIAETLIFKVLCIHVGLVATPLRSRGHAPRSLLCTGCHAPQPRLLLMRRFNLILVECALLCSCRHGPRDIQLDSVTKHTMCRNSDRYAAQRAQAVPVSALQNVCASDLHYT